MKICLNCEKEFESKLQRARFCSDKCRATFNQNIKGQRDRIIVTIYSLVNPLNNQIFYVGKTVGTLDQRLASHLRDEINIEKTSIIRTLKEKNLEPIIKEVERFICTNEQEEYEALTREGYWIKKYADEGYVLCNKGGKKGQIKPRLLRNYEVIKENRKGYSTGIRFNIEQLELAKKKSGLQSAQQLVDFLIDRYVNGENPIMDRQADYSNNLQQANTWAKSEPFQEPKQVIRNWQYYMNAIPEIKTIAECNKLNGEIQANGLLLPNEKKILQSNLVTHSKTLFND